jgi:hypothetical protein
MTSHQVVGQPSHRQVVVETPPKSSWGAKTLKDVREELWRVKQALAHERVASKSLQLGIQKLTRVEKEGIDFRHAHPADRSKLMACVQTLRVQVGELFVLILFTKLALIVLIVFYNSFFIVLLFLAEFVLTLLIFLAELALYYTIFDQTRSLLALIVLVCHAEFVVTLLAFLTELALCCTDISG